MGVKQEIWDLYDRDGNRTGETFVRAFGNYKTIPLGRYHLTVDLLVLHEDGTYLLTKRSDDKDIYPGYWEASAGGAAVSGEEPLEAAEREGRSMYYSYIAKVSCDKDSIVLQEGETTDYKWVDKDGLLAYVNSEHTMTNHNKRYEKYFNTLV